MKGQAAKSTRVAAVDGLRGLLATIVLAWHVGAPFGLNWLLAAANAAVALFFVLSGYVLTRSWDGRFGVFLVRRFVRLWPVYAVCMLAGYAIAGVPPVWSEFVWYPFIGPNDTPAINPPAWSLFIEVYAMPLMPFIVWCGSATFLRAVLAMGGLLLASIAQPYVAILALFIAGAFFAHSDFRNGPLEWRVPQWLGRISYSLYLSHVLVLTVAVRLFGPWGGVAAIPAALLAGWLLWRFVEQPSIRASRKLGMMYKRPAHA